MNTRFSTILAHFLFLLTLLLVFPWSPGQLHARKQGSGDVLYGQGVEAFSAGKFKAAFVYYRRALKLEPNHSGANNNLGYLYYRRGEYKTALKCFARAIRTRPKFLLAYMNEGNTYYRIRNYRRAVRSYRNALRVDGRYLHAHFNLGNTYFKMKAYHGAVRSYRKALHVHPKYSNVHLNLGLALNKVGKKGRATYHFKKSLELKDNFYAHYELSKIYRDKGHEANFIKHNKRACDLGRVKSCKFR